MYAVDPLARTLCFTDGKEGMAFVSNKWENRCSDLSYTLAGNGSLVSGIELNRVAAIVDLGTANDFVGDTATRTQRMVAWVSLRCVLKAARS